MVNERPLEEIIGWYRRTSDGWPIDPEVDDLAVWLASRGYAHTMAGALIEGAQQYVRADLDFPPSAIRETLIAAVRKVAGE